MVLRNAVKNSLCVDLVWMAGKAKRRHAPPLRMFWPTWPTFLLLLLSEEGDTQTLGVPFR